MLSLQNVSLIMDDEGEKINILKDVNIEFEKGKRYALTGPNGGGKSSIARVIMGIYNVTGGNIYFGGEEISHLNVTERARLGFGYAFQHPPRFKGMKVSDLLEVAFRHSNNMDCRALSDMGLCPEDYLDRELDSSLSGGEMKRIEIATILAQDPSVRVFDEPEAGIDLWSFDRLIRVIAETHTPERITVIITHQEKILNSVDEILLISDGTVTMKGDKDTIWPRIREDAACACRKNCRKEGEQFAECPR